jgi:hypothetical protein
MDADLMGISDAVFADDQTSAGFSFVTPLQNGDAQAVNSIISETAVLPGLNEKCTLQLVLQHTPK